MDNDVGLLQTDVVMFIYLQKFHRVFGNITFWFNRHYIDDVEALFSTIDLYIECILTMLYLVFLLSS